MPMGLPAAHEVWLRKSPSTSPSPLAGEGWDEGFIPLDWLSLFLGRSSMR